MPSKPPGRGRRRLKIQHETASQIAARSPHRRGAHPGARRHRALAPSIRNIAQSWRAPVGAADTTRPHGRRRERAVGCPCGAPAMAASAHRLHGAAAVVRDRRSLLGGGRNDCPGPRGGHALARLPGPAALGTAAGSPARRAQAAVRPRGEHLRCDCRNVRGPERGPRATRLSARGAAVQFRPGVRRQPPQRRGRTRPSWPHAWSMAPKRPGAPSTGSTTFPRPRHSPAPRGRWSWRMPGRPMATPNAGARSTGSARWPRLGRSGVTVVLVRSGR